MHKDIEWKQLFFEIPVFFYSPCRYLDIPQLVSISRYLDILQLVSISRYVDILQLVSISIYLDILQLVSILCWSETESELWLLAVAGVVLAWHWRGSVKATARDGEGGEGGGGGGNAGKL